MEIFGKHVIETQANRYIIYYDQIMISLRETWGLLFFEKVITKFELKTTFFSKKRSFEIFLRMSQ